MAFDYVLFFLLSSNNSWKKNGKLYLICFLQDGCHDPGYWEKLSYLDGSEYMTSLFSLPELPHSGWNYLTIFFGILLKFLLAVTVCAKHWSSLREVRLQRDQRLLLLLACKHGGASPFSTDGRLALTFATNSVTERLSMSQHRSPQHC